VTTGSSTLVQTRKATSYGLNCFFWQARRVWLAGLPGLFLFSMHLRDRVAVTSGFHLPSLTEVTGRIANTLVFEGPINFFPWNPGLKLLTVVLIFALFAFTLGKKSASPERLWRREEIKVVVFIGCAMLLFVITPDMTDEAAFVPVRFLYSVFLLMMFFAAFHLSRTEAWISCLLAILPFAYSHQRSVYRDAQTLHPYAIQIQDVAQHIRPGSGVLTLAYNTTSRLFEAYVFEQAPLRNLNAYPAVEGQSVLLNNYEGIANSFPLRLRSEVRTPELRILQGEFLPNKFSYLKSFITQHHDLLDYVIVWETDHGSVGEPEKKAIRQLVSANFRLVYENQMPAPLYLYAH